MAKKYRGKNIKVLGWRGTCPLCKRPRVKLLWVSKDENGDNINICKVCDKYSS